MTDKIKKRNISLFKKTHRKTSKKYIITKYMKYLYVKKLKKKKISYILNFTIVIFS